MIWTHCTDAFVHIHAHNTRTFVTTHERQTFVPRFGLRNDIFICFRLQHGGPRLGLPTALICLKVFQTFYSNCHHHPIRPAAAPPRRSSASHLQPLVLPPRTTAPPHMCAWRCIELHTCTRRTILRVHCRLTRRNFCSPDSFHPSHSSNPKKPTFRVTAEKSRWKVMKKGEASNV